MCLASIINNRSRTENFKELRLPVIDDFDIYKFALRNVFILLRLLIIDIFTGVPKSMGDSV